MQSGISLRQMVTASARVGASLVRKSALSKRRRATFRIELESSTTKQCFIDFTPLFLRSRTVFWMHSPGMLVAETGYSLVKADD